MNTPLFASQVEAVKTELLETIEMLTTEQLVDLAFYAREMLAATQVNLTARGEQARLSEEVVHE